MQDDRLAFFAGIFYVRRFCVTKDIWYPCTPVYRLNGHTAFVLECVEQRDRHGYLFYFYEQFQVLFQ